MKDNLLTQGLMSIGFQQAFIPHLEEKMEAYTKELMLFNAAYDLVGANSKEDIIIRHILDSLSPVLIIQQLVENAATNSGQEVVIGDSVEEIGIGAFENCSSLKKVTLGKNIIKLNDNVLMEWDSKHTTVEHPLDTLYKLVSPK